MINMHTAHTRQCLRRFMNIQQIYYLYSAYLAYVTVGLPTGWPTDWETGCIVYTYFQPVVQLVVQPAASCIRYTQPVGQRIVQPVGKPAVSCKHASNRLSNWLGNRLYRVYAA